jgi:hypothetical protein
MRPYFGAVIGLDTRARPWTAHLMRCATAVAHVTYMYFKARFKRVRPSVLCPGLAPPFGPPQHPAFPSGHSTAAHLVALFLLQVPGIAQLYGVSDAGKRLRRGPTTAELRDPAQDAALQASLPLWLARRIARNRERLGLHYRSDSGFGRSLAVGLHGAIFETRTLPLPTLDRVLVRAQAEWPTFR